MEKHLKHHRNIVIITPVTNTKLEGMFSCILRVRTDWMNRLVNEQLDHNLRIGEVNK